MRSITPTSLLLLALIAAQSAHADVLWLSTSTSGIVGPSTYFSTQAELSDYRYFDSGGANPYTLAPLTGTVTETGFDGAVGARSTATIFQSSSISALGASTVADLSGVVAAYTSLFNAYVGSSTEFRVTFRVTSPTTLRLMLDGDFEWSAQPSYARAYWHWVLLAGDTPLLDEGFTVGGVHSLDLTLQSEIDYEFTASTYLFLSAFRNDLPDPFFAPPITGAAQVTFSASITLVPDPPAAIVLLLAVHRRRRCGVDG
ncbi:MAG: hypothetical protein ACREJO_06980 [Phycisphaerales bacterium]